MEMRADLKERNNMRRKSEMMPLTKGKQAKKKSATNLYAEDKKRRRR
jgi:hypothetical protein